MDTRNQENSDEGFDDVGGALFSRIPSKQHNIENLANRSSDSTGKDGVDGTLFSRVTSQKDDSTANKAHHRNQIYKPVGDENVTLECSIKPEDLSDTDDDERHPKPEEKESSCSSSDISCYDDLSDAIHFSRVSSKREEKPEIQRVTSSTFHMQPPLIEGDNDIDSTSEQRVQDIDYETPNNAMLSNGFNQARQTTKPKQSEGNTSYEMSHFECDENVVLQNELTLNSTDEKYSSESPMLNNDSKTIKSSNCRQLTKPLIFPVVSLVIYFSDIASDIRLAVSYRENGDINLFWITLSCILIPHVLMAIMDVSWVWLDRKHGHKNRCRLILGCLTLGRIIRALSYMRHVYKAKRIPKVKNDNTPGGHHHRKTRDWHKNRARDEKRDCFLLDFINAFMESAPQLFVQLYLYYAYNLELTFLRVLNLLSSWISIAWTYAAYYRCNREALAGTQDVKIIGFAFFFCSVLSALAARFICTTLFLVHFYTWIGLSSSAVHFNVMSLWICIKEKPKLEGTTASTCGRYLYYVFFAYVSILCFMNLNDTRAKVRMTVFYTVIYIENTIMAVLSIWKINENETGSDKAIHLIILPVGCILHVVLLVNYYLFLHPKTGICYNCNRSFKKASHI